MTAPRSGRDAFAGFRPAPAAVFLSGELRGASCHATFLRGFPQYIRPRATFAAAIFDLGGC